MGFDQNPDFDKECGSNSYETKEDEKDETNSDMSDMKSAIMKMAEDLEKGGVKGMVDLAESNIKSIEENTDTKFKELVTFDTPTDIVIFGHNDDNYNTLADFMVTDDETGFDLYINGVEKSTLSSSGFGSIMTLDEYKKLYSKRGEEMAEFAIVDGHTRALAPLILGCVANRCTAVVVGADRYGWRRLVHQSTPTVATHLRSGLGDAYVFLAGTTSPAWCGATLVCRHRAGQRGAGAYSATQSVV
jgi:hypothetical protein